MRIISSIAAVAMLIAGGAAIAKSNPEAELAREIEGRVAGAPVKCISMTNLRSTRIIDKTAIVYDAGSTIYVNRPRGGAERLDQWDILVTKPFGSQICTPETVHLVDRTSQMTSGFVSLGEFVPYKKVKTARN